MEKEQLVKLVTAAQGGDGDALNELFNAFYNDVYYFALKTVKDDNLACDITQEAFVEIINTLGNLKEPAAFVTWMKQITYHQCTRYFKKKKDVIVDEDEDGNTVFDTLKEENAEFIPDEALEQSDFKKTVLAILDELSEEQRSATMMYYFDELSVKQIAEIQGVSEGTVKSRLNYARKAIKASVEEYEKKNGIRLHAFGFFPFIKWLFADGASAGMPAGAAASAASSVSTATGVGISVTSAASGATAAASTTATAAAGIGAKIAALPIATKIVSGIVAASIVIGGTTAGVLLSGDEPADPAGNDLSSSASVEQTPADDDDDYRYTNFSDAEDAIWNYVSQFSVDYEMPYFESADELSADKVVRFLYYFWGGWINGNETQKTVSAKNLNKLCLEVFGREYDFSKVTGEHAKYNSETDEVEILNFELANVPDVEARIDSGSVVDCGEGVYSQYITLTAEEYEKPIISGTITVKKVGENWYFVSYIEEILGSGDPFTDEAVEETAYYLPQGWSYIKADGTILSEGAKMPQAQMGDKILTPEYEMRFGKSPDFDDNGNIAWIGDGDTTWYPLVLDKTKTSYTPLPD